MVLWRFGALETSWRTLCMYQDLTCSYGLTSEVGCMARAVHAGVAQRATLSSAPPDADTAFSCSFIVGSKHGTGLWKGILVRLSHILN